MKKGTKLVALLLGVALMVPACTPGAESNKSSQEPSTSSEAPVNYKVTISNKEELQAEWFVGDQSRKVNLEVEPKANITQLVNDGIIKITSSDPAKLSIEGQMASPVAAGEVTITVKCGESEDTVKVTLQAKQTVKEKYGVAHEGTEADPFDNEDACKVAKHEKYNNEDFYVKGKVASFYHLPGSRTDGAVSFFLEPATAGGEQFEVYKCYKSTGSGEESYLKDSDIWVGAIALAHGTFTTFGEQAETTGAKLVKVEGEPPAPRQTLTKTFAEVLAVGNALKDGDAAWDYYKFQGYVTVKAGYDYYLTATKGEALVAGKSDAAHGERDIKGTNAIELFNAGSVAELADKLLEGAKIEVTMIVKNYHGTIENGLSLKNEDVTVLEAGTKWSVPEPAVTDKTVTEFIALENNKKNAYKVKATIKAFKSGETKDEYGNMTITDGTSDLIIYGCSATETALAWDGAGEYAFKNPKDFLTNEATKDLKVGDEITMKLIRNDFNGTVQGNGIIIEDGGSGEDKEYESLAKYTFTTQTAENVRSISPEVAKTVFTKATGEDILGDFTTATSVYEGAQGGSGDNAWKVFNILKIGKSKTAGKLVFNTTADVSKIVVKGVSWTQTSTLTMNGKAVSGAFAGNVVTKDVIVDGAITNAGTLSFEFDAAKTITIDCTNSNTNANFGVIFTEMEFFAEK